MFIKSVMPSNHLILCHPLLLLPSIFPSNRVFSKGSVLCIRLPKYWNFIISPSTEPSGLISFRMDWFDLLAVQGALKRLIQHHNWKSISYSVLSFLYGPTLTSIYDYWENLLFSMLSRFIIDFSSKEQVSFLISWLKSPSSVILELQKNKVCHSLHCLPFYLPWSNGTRCHDLCLLNVEF